MTTIISLSQNMKVFKNSFVNSLEIEAIIDLDECTDYRDQGSNAELLIYNERQIIYSCCYNEYYDRKFITHIYNRNAELVYKYEIDYNINY